jgi:predicted HicB family RNase H-like nuclease
MLLGVVRSSHQTSMKRVNVQVPDEVHTKAKVIAVLKGVTLNEYLESAIRDAVDRDKGVLESLKR